VFSSFILLLIGQQVFGLDAATLQTLIFVKLAVAGHLTLYLARTGVHHFWTRPFPSKLLFIATEVAQIVGTLFAVYGVFMNPLGCVLAGFVWGYALLAFLITATLKIRYFRLMRHRDVKLQR
jgi:H+-transporting ATPase